MKNIYEKQRIKEEKRIKKQERETVKAVSDILGVTTSKAKKFINYQQKDFVIMSFDNSNKTTRQYIPQITEHKDPMIESIKLGIMRWIDYHDQVAKLSDVDPLYSLPDVPCITVPEKETITKMRTFLYNFYRHGFWNIVATCDFIGVSIMDVRNWTTRFFSFKSAISLIMSTRDDFAESLLLKHMSGDGMAAAQCTMFYLKTMAKHRGWAEQADSNAGKSERSELTKQQVDRMAEQQRMRLNIANQQRREQQQNSNNNTKPQSQNHDFTDEQYEEIKNKIHQGNNFNADNKDNDTQKQNIRDQILSKKKPAIANHENKQDGEDEQLTHNFDQSFNNYVFGEEDDPIECIATEKSVVNIIPTDKELIDIELSDLKKELCFCEDECFCDESCECYSDCTYIKIKKEKEKLHKIKIGQAHADSCQSNNITDKKYDPFNFENNFIKEEAKEFADQMTSEHLKLKHEKYKRNSASDIMTGAGMLSLGAKPEDLDNINENDLFESNGEE